MPPNHQLITTKGEEKVFFFLFFCTLTLSNSNSFVFDIDRSPWFSFSQHMGKYWIMHTIAHVTQHFGFVSMCVTSSKWWAGFCLQLPQELTCEQCIQWWRKELWWMFFFFSHCLSSKVLFAFWLKNKRSKRKRGEICNQKLVQKELNYSETFHKFFIPDGGRHNMKNKLWLHWRRGWRRRSRWKYQLTAMRPFV